MVARDATNGRYINGANMESLKGQVGDTLALPKDAIKGAFQKPVVIVGVLILALTFVLIVEAYKPGAFTGPIRRMLRAIGVKTA